MDLKSTSEYIAFRLAIGLLRQLPYGWSERSLRGAGRFTGSVLRLRRQVVLEQLHMVFPAASPEDLVSLADKVYDHLGQTAAEVFCADAQRLLSRTTAEPGFDDLDQVLASGNGAIVVTGHIGNFELGGALLAQRYPLLDVVKPQRNAAFDRYIQRLRHARGIRTVPVDRSVSAVMKHLRLGGLVSLVLDQDAGAAGLATDFLGHRASTWPGAARLSLRTGCAVVPVGMQRCPDGRHVLHIDEPLWPDNQAGGGDGVEMYLKRISSAIEAHVRRTPEQWFWVHRRWKGAEQVKAIHDRT